MKNILKKQAVALTIALTLGVSQFASAQQGYIVLNGHNMTANDISAIAKGAQVAISPSAKNGQKIALRSC